MGLPLFILIKMKDLTIVINTEIGARYVMMPSEFLVSIAQANEVIFVCFHEIGTGKLLHTVFLFVEEDEEKHIREFSNYSKKGQKQILDDMREFIIEDINNLLSENHDDKNDPYPIVHRSYFDHQEFEKRWYTFYDMITEALEGSEEYFVAQNKKCLSLKKVDCF